MGKFASTPSRNPFAARVSISACVRRARQVTRPGTRERVRRNGRRVAASMPHTQANGLLPPGPSTISFVAAVVVSVRSPCPPVSVRPRPSLLASPLSVDR